MKLKLSNRYFWLALSLTMGWTRCAFANPSGLTIKSGGATTQTSGSHLTVTTTGPLTILNWGNFNIQSGEHTTFVEPSASSVVFNLIGGNTPSQILGSLSANGTVLLANPHGFYFGPNSLVNVGGSFVATTTALPTDAGFGGSWEFTGAPPLAKIINYGKIAAGQNQSLYLISEDIENHGNLTAPGGNVGLCAGQQVLLTDQADGRGLSAAVKLPAGSVDNSGHITADAGTIALNAQVVNQNGVLQADSVVNHNGTIELVASGEVNLGPDSQILARGDNSLRGSAGGNITLDSGSSFSDSSGSQIIATGGANGGNGGHISLCAPDILSMNSEMNTSAQAGSTAGTLFLDPTTITINSSGTGTVSGGTILDTSAPTSLTLSTTYLNNQNFSSIDLQATGNITLSAPWTIPSTATLTSLTLQAGNNISLGSGDSIKVQNGASVTLVAGANFASINSSGGSPTAVNAGTGSISLTTTAGVQTAGGNINFVAGNGITLGSGAIQVTGGGAGSINFSAGGTMTLGTANVQTTGGGSITLQDPGNISLGSGWTLASAPSGTSPVLTLNAGGNITLNNGDYIKAGDNWSVDLQAGGNISLTGSTEVQTTTGGITLQAPNGSVTLSGTAYLQTQKGGSINVSASGDVTVGGGNICTLDGGNINVTATAGSINAGTDNAGYATSGSQFNFISQGVSVGGIATADGGNVSLVAGDNVISTPNVQAGQAPGASGAYGSNPGNVFISAGNAVLGNYIVANGVGTIYAGMQLLPNQTTPTPVNNPLYPTPNVGNATSAANLYLASGTWNVWAANNIYLAEVLNFNGAFNNKQYTGTIPAGEFPGDINDAAGLPYYFFNYAPNAAASLNAANGIVLTGTMPTSAAANEHSIYPPDLSLTAGSGGISLENNIILYPSSEGSLTITTTGDINGEYNGSTFGITMSGSGTPNYQNFAGGQAVTPLHLADSNPVTVNAADIESFNLTVPTFAQINVSGNTYNFNFAGQNLSPTETTSIDVGGSIGYRSDITTETLATPLPSVLFSPIPVSILKYVNAVSAPALYELYQTEQSLQYDAATGTLAFHGNMTAAEETFLLNPTQIELSAGKPVLAANGEPVLEPLTLTAAQQTELATAIPALYTASQSANAASTGLILSGPGHFKVNAGTIDLGASAGIQVDEGNSAVTAITPDTADVTVTTTGDLAMTYSKIADEGLFGDVTLNVGGSLDVGAENVPFATPNIVGVFTTGGGAISITANGNVDVDGSRVVTYDGGNIDIRSKTGDVDAGEGGAGLVDVQGVSVNKKTGQLIDSDDFVPGSGILATVLPRNSVPLGNITIEAPEGNINASKGGILQIALNSDNTDNAFISLNAGKDINATGSGVIGANLQLNAGGSVNGVLVSTGTINVAAAVNANVTAIAKGDVNISATGDVTGTIVSAGTANVSGQSITASLISQSVNANGSTTGSSIGVPVSNVAKQDNKVAEDASEAVAQNDGSDDSDDKKKKAANITLAQKASRVTVVLPGKKQLPQL